MSRLPDALAEKLSKRLGDVVANRLIKLAGVLGGVPGALGGRLAATYVEYLRDESPMLPKAAQVNQWKSDVAMLVEELEQLEKRLKSLESSER